MNYTDEEIKEITGNIISKHSKDFNFKEYEPNFPIRPTGDSNKNVYIVREGIFCSVKFVKELADGAILGFYYPGSVIVPAPVVFPNFHSALSLKSVKNKFAFRCSIYEIPLEQWEYVASEYNSQALLASIFSASCMRFVDYSILARQNRSTEKRIVETYMDYYKEQTDRKDKCGEIYNILHSGIPYEVLANYFGVKVHSFKKMLFTAECEWNTYKTENNLK